MIHAYTHTHTHAKAVQKQHIHTHTRRQIQRDVVQRVQDLLISHVHASTNAAATNTTSDIARHYHVQFDSKRTQ